MLVNLKEMSDEMGQRLKAFEGNDVAALYTLAMIGIAIAERLDRIGDLLEKQNRAYMAANKLAERNLSQTGF